MFWLDFAGLIKFYKILIQMLMTFQEVILQAAMNFWMGGSEEVKS